MLNRECLIRSKAFGQDEEINVLILSADTCDESLESKWFTFLQTIRKLLNQSQVDFEENVKDGQEHLENKINQVQEQLQQEMKEQNEITIKMVKKIIQTQENAQNARNQMQHQIRTQMQNAQMGQGQRQGGQQQQQQRQGQQQQQQRQGQAQLRNPSMNQSVLGSISEQIELESNIPRSQSMALDIVPNSRSESMNSQQSQPQPKKKKQIKKKGTF